MQLSPLVRVNWQHRVVSGKERWLGERGGSLAGEPTSGRTEMRNKECIEIVARNNGSVYIQLTLLLPDTHICINFSTVYNDTLVAKELNKWGLLACELMDDNLFE